MHMQILGISQLEAFERAAMAAIAEILRANRKLIIAYSGGKDSTAMLLMVLNVARMLRAEGVIFPEILITHGNTGIENPNVVALVHMELAKARAFARRHDFGLRAEIAMPLLNDTWAVAILSGRKLPTFASSSTRDCTIMFKIDPMNRLRKQILREEAGQPRGGPPVTLIGTRFEESDGRAVRMNERGETAYTPWEQKGEWFMSPIANWTSDDVWEYIGEYKNGQRHGYTDGHGVWDMYADAGATGTCAIVADMATESLKKARACGARFGCALCAAVGRDKSLENMLLLPQFQWLENVNRIQRFIVDTQWDWNRRTWVGRSINDDGYIKIEPDTYSPAMLQELLRYCLTADIIEQRASNRLGIPPRFQLVTEEQLLAIDALWSLNGIQERPFTAAKIWDEVYNRRERFFPPEIEPTPHSPMPAARYIFVGPDWDGGVPQRFTGFRDVWQEAFAGDDDAGCVGTRDLADGRTIMDIEVASSLGFDPEATELFFQFELEYVLRNFYSNPNYACTSGFFHYVRLNMIETSSGHAQAHVDRIMRRTSWRIRNGLAGEVSQETLVAKSVSKAEMKAELAMREPAEVEVEPVQVLEPTTVPEIPVPEVLVERPKQAQLSLEFA